MISFKTVNAFCLGVTLCTAQTINIRGVVQDSGGAGIVGATVKLEKANVTATSGVGGAFTLAGSVSSAKAPTTLNVMSANPVLFRNGQIVLTLTGTTSIGISIHDFGGRQVFSSKRMFSSGTNSLRVPMQTAGIFLCKVAIGNEAYSFKALSFGESSTHQGVVSRGPSALAKDTKAAAVIDDVIAVTKAEYLNYRCVIANSDTSGVVIEMLPNAGEVTDVDGNVYQSVQIGNQVWMTENLRVTKFNDGSAIPLNTSTSTWIDISTPIYCYYNNTTNADSIKKYGALYNWYVVSPTNAQKIAPAGWHVPSLPEWDTLIIYLIANGHNWDGSKEGNKIAKALAAQTDWPRTTAAGAIGTDLSKNNSSGFSALPGGYRDRWSGLFWDDKAIWWSATEDDMAGPYNGHALSYYEEYMFGFGDHEWDFGFSVRLLRD